MTRCTTYSFPMDLDFTEDEIRRYSRHILLQDVGGIGQAKLKAARVLVIGAGGLGSPLTLYLAAAGVGTIGIVDHDRLELSNLQRQIAHTTDRIGQPKAESAALSAHAINPEVTIEPHDMRIDADNAADMISRYDIICDGTDNFATRFLVADACVLGRRTLVSAAVLRFEGQLSVFKPHIEGPCYRCLYPGGAARRRRADLLRSRRIGRRDRRDGHIAGNRSAEGDPRHRRKSGRKAADMGRAGDPLPDGAPAPRPDLRAVQPFRHHQGLVAAPPNGASLCRLSRSASCYSPARTTVPTTPSC